MIHLSPDQIWLKILMRNSTWQTTEINEVKVLIVQHRDLKSCSYCFIFIVIPVEIRLQHEDYKQKLQGRFWWHKHLLRSFSEQMSQWLFIRLFIDVGDRPCNLWTKWGFCNKSLRCILCPRFHFQIARGDCNLPVVSRVYFGGGSLRHFSCLWIGYYAAEQLGRRGLGVKAFSVSVSMCALYTSVCVYASVSYGCFFIRVWKCIPHQCECASVCSTSGRLWFSS